LAASASGTWLTRSLPVAGKTGVGHGVQEALIWPLCHAPRHSAKAGIQGFSDVSHAEAGNQGSSHAFQAEDWTPAFAGVTLMCALVRGMTAVRVPFARVMAVCALLAP